MGKRHNVSVFWKAGGISEFANIVAYESDGGFLWILEGTAPTKRVAINMALVSQIEAQEVTVH